ncbi:lysophospholipid acyltransferase family protein [Marinobacter sp.]|uniref:lysophospholipid acyltransferase family protein n=1 Tax=Marinobacter sp. TaxID=50741 RepID=UPI0034A2FF10
MGTLRLSLRLTLFCGFLIVTGLIAATCLTLETVTRRPINRAPIARFCFDYASRCLGFRIRQQGVPAKNNVLFVSNHVSWSDIPVLGGRVPLRFLSKAEVGRWPVIGWLAQQAGTLFITRGGGRAREAQAEISATLVSGQSVLVFPEGTTSSGLSVLPFHSRLLQAAPQAGVAIQPISIAYTRNGRPDQLAPFIGDDDFQHHLPRMLRQAAVEVTVVFHPAVPVSNDQSLADLAETLRQTVAGGVQTAYQDRAGYQSSGRPWATSSSVASRLPTISRSK